MTTARPFRGMMRGEQELISDAEWIAAAEESRTHAYAPYSVFSVGAALLAEDGSLFPGCNVENASYSATCCAERAAFCRAVSEGHRSFLGIAIVGGPAGKPVSRFCMPCGVCRQVMREFCREDFVVLTTNGRQIRRRTLAELLPDSFSAEEMGGGR